jgi:iron complex outermembrane receptor protein
MRIHFSFARVIAAVFFVVPVITLLPAVSMAAVDEMIVEVRKKSENIQDVPISVSVLGAQQIERQGISNVQGVAKYTPGIEFDNGFGGQDNRIVIRGMSPTRGRSNAAFLVDGIDFTGEALTTAGSAFSINQRLLDVERIEVVKGPQSALYGRSAFAGAIQYITKNPSLENWEADIATDLGSDEQYQLTGAVGGPITSNFGLRLNALAYDEAGFYESVLTGGEVGGGDGAGAALTGLWEATDKLTFKARLAYSQDNYQPAAQARVASNTLVNLQPSSLVGTPAFPIVAFGISGNYPDCNPFPSNPATTLASCANTPKVLTTGTVSNIDGLGVAQAANPVDGSEYPGTEVDMTTFTLNADWDTRSGIWSSDTGLAKQEGSQLFDGTWDAMPAGNYTSLDGSWSFVRPPCGPTGLENCSPIGQQVNFENDTDLFSQEFRYSSTFEGPVNFATGVLYWNEKAEQHEGSMTVSPSFFRLTPGAPGPPPANFSAPTAASVFIDGNGNGLNVMPGFKSRETEHWSIYGLIDWEISSAWKLTLEGRYVDEELTNIGAQCLPGPTETLSGRPSSDTDGDGINDACASQFRGTSSLTTAVAGGTLPVGSYTNAVTGPLQAKSTDSFFTPKGTVEWRSSDTKMWYASIAQGQKPGGISSIQGGTFFDPDNNGFDTEKLLAYEIGGKTSWAGGAVIVNGAMFFQDYTDKQVGVTQFDPRIGSDVSSIENAGEAEIFGIELDASWTINENWFVSAAYTWLDAEYTKFESLTGSSTEVARTQFAGNGGCLELIDVDPDPANFSNVCRVDRKGNKIEDVPENAFVGYLKWNTPIGKSDMNLFVDTNVIFNDERFVEENNIKKLDSYWLMDVRLGLVTDSWEVVLFADNVLDDDTPKSAIDVGSQTETFKQAQWPPGPTDGLIVSMPDPRVVGMRAAFRFGK